MSGTSMAAPHMDKAVRGPAQFTRLFDVDTLGFDSTFSNDISGSGGLSKRGAGSLQLTGHNTYSMAFLPPTLLRGQDHAGSLSLKVKF
ncbi:MAG: hypothetical protein ACN6OD_04420 [Alcaligenes sp.]